MRGPHPHEGVRPFLMSRKSLLDAGPAAPSRSGRPPDIHQHITFLLDQKCIETTPSLPLESTRRTRAANHFITAQHSQRMSNQIGTIHSQKNQSDGH